MATASSEHHMSTRYHFQTYSRTGMAWHHFRNGAASVQRNGSSADQRLASSADGMTGPVRARRSRLAKETRDIFIFVR